MNYKRFDRFDMILTAFISLIFLSFLSFGGCAWFKTAEDHMNDLSQAINTEWTAKINKDWGTVYDLLTEASKSAIKRDNFIRHANVEVLNFTIKDIQIAPDGKTATATIDYTAFQMGYQLPAKTTEEWMLENGQWRRLKRPRDIGFPLNNKRE